MILNIPDWGLTALSLFGYDCWSLINQVYIDMDVYIDFEDTKKIPVLLVLLEPLVDARVASFWLVIDIIPCLWGAFDPIRGYPCRDS